MLTVPALATPVAKSTLPLKVVQVASAVAPAASEMVVVDEEGILQAAAIG